ncbi:MAG: hypothetical protein PHN19_05675 [Patescibacteria group bacterium]|nr:hypothetical protein [Patescibacteria group bacterium]
MTVLQVKDLDYSLFLENPTHAYYPLDCAGVVILTEGDKQLGLIISDFSLYRLTCFWKEHKRDCNVIEIDLIQLMQDPTCIVRNLETGNYVHIVGDELREKEMCAAPIADLDYILHC